MQLLPIVLIGVLLMADGGLGVDAALSPGVLALGTIAPIAIVLALQWLGTAWCGRRLRGRGAPAAVRLADRLSRGARLLLAGHFAFAALVLGLLLAIRDVTGNLLLVDELLALFPTLAGLAFTWWIYYPVERRLRDALLVRHIDQGEPLFLPPGRGRYVLMQVRLQLLFLLVPILLILGAGEAIDLAVAALDGSRLAVLGEGATVVAAAMVVLTAPQLARIVLEVEPLEAGELRTRLLDMCRAHRVRVRDVLVWRTHGSLVNAAVMGLIGPLRYVLLTDALLESMEGQQLESVMAHEIGHVRRHHMFWLLVCVVASSIVVAVPLFWVQLGLEGATGPWAKAMAAGSVIAGAGAVLLAFGWVSRRFERQADAFAVRHLDGAAGAISAQAVGVLSAALRRVAAQSAVPAQRHSWRHGSIAARQAHLESLVGLPQERLPIDREVRWIKAVSAAIAAAGLLYGVALG
jgi:Zn-dependent protease with chaperone function